MLLISVLMYGHYSCVDERSRREFQPAVFFALGRTFFVTSVRGNFFAPQIAAMSALRTFGAKMPFPAFFIASAFFLPAAFFAVFPSAYEHELNHIEKM